MTVMCQTLGHFVHTCVAAVLALAFLLSSGPITMCLGDDGHQVIERSHVPTQCSPHENQTDTHPIEHDANQDYCHAGETSCIDMPFVLILETRVGSQRDLYDVLQSLQVSTPLIFELTSDSENNQPRGGVTTMRSSHSMQPVTASLRSVIILV